MITTVVDKHNPTPFPVRVTLPAPGPLAAVQHALTLNGAPPRYVRRHWLNGTPEVGDPDARAIAYIGKRGQLLILSTASKEAAEELRETMLDWGAADAGMVGFLCVNDIIDLRSER